MKNKIFSLFLIYIFFSSIAAAQESTKLEEPELNIVDKVDPSRFYNTAIIQGMNKTTAKSSLIEMPIEEKINFGQISIIAHKCWQSSLDQKPESKILLEVFENKSGENPKRIFYGWMFASSPSISGLEHPIYDLTALSCKNK